MNRTNTTPDTATLPRPFLWFAGASALTCLFYWPSIAPLLRKWLQFDHSLGHGLTLFLMVCVWLWTCRGRFDAAATAPSLVGLLLTALTTAAWLAVALGDIALLEQLTLIGLFFSLAVLVAGWKSALVLAPPLAMLLFCIPIFDELNDQLVQLSSLVVGAFFDLTPITYFMAGNTIILPSGTIVIAGGCSGLRYLVVGLALANLASSMNALSWRNQIIANLLAIALMLFVNWFRIIVIVGLAYITEMRTPLVENHENFGWVVFAVGLIPLLLYVRKTAQMSSGA
jgi:exosortase